MDVDVVVEEVAGKNKMTGGVHPDYFIAEAKTVASGLTIRGVGEHTDQDAAEALAIADFKVRYAEAFPPKRIVITKKVTLSL